MAKIDELQTELAQARKDMQALASLAGDTAVSAASDAASLATAHLDQLSSEARVMYDNALAEGQKLNQATRDQIKANPLAATGIAFALGLLLASFLRRN